MKAEGKGTIAPARVKYEIDEAQARYWLNCVLLQQAKYSGRGGYSGGILSDRYVPILREHVAGNILAGLAGKLGEAAAWWFFHRHGFNVSPPSQETLPTGDGGIDIRYDGRTIQVKTRTRNSGKVLVLHRRESGSLVKIEWELIVAVEWCGGSTVELLGWCRYRPHVENAKIEPSPYANILNKSIADADLEPMASIVTELKCRF